MNAEKDNVVHLNNGGQIHQTAVVHPDAKIGENVEVGPYAVIGEHVEIGADTEIGPHTVIKGWTTIGKNNKIFNSASIGQEPQDLKFAGEKSFLEIGDNNTIREFATIHRGTEDGGRLTKIGNDNLIMAYCHVAHDCQVGNDIIMSNSANLAGHVIVEDSAVIGGLVGVHQFVRIGEMAMVGAGSKVVKDVPPYILVDGHPSSVNGINIVGLRRNEVKPEVRRKIKQAYKILYRSNLNTNQAIEEMEEELDNSPLIENFLRFLRNAQRGICR
ncbi:acyl-(acyl-carrier-protein)--UDP-N-acetylglucosamine O-acyltransferase [Halobacteroides halobius DSM 5150]|uniref:Acyl-[acyl-carrier-protein]--UDP-N-acetylglucosamine O-acyltransferase n=1 Tax=Halobacteroides halobius (strain ATCC 35273 / DSM 5150 / MD-1) TaxID=748449 RepID=L0KD71_HALHC|nr:acyl-ACP--UDP-N-acetylglucosamine O-acyltransferase [Halobacteroides halobius]AGB42299.1 acyl-(acyl-carrier-protein)--UDP-N-acetylglucosamine O-acyltransferase [Halobacteroides halobius DSM 5150]